MWKRGITSKNVKRLDGFLIARVDKKDTRLPYEIWLHSLGKRGKMGNLPRVGAVLGKRVVPISISETPEILSRDVMPKEEVIFDWVRQNRKALMLHWNGVIDDFEVLVVVSKPVD